MVNNIVPNDIFSQHLLSKSGVYCLAVLPSEAERAVLWISSAASGPRGLKE